MARRETAAQFLVADVHRTVEREIGTPVSGSPSKWPQITERYQDLTRQFPNWNRELIRSNRELNGGIRELFGCIREEALGSRFLPPSPSYEGSRRYCRPGVKLRGPLTSPAKGVGCRWAPAGGKARAGLVLPVSVLHSGRAQRTCAVPVSVRQFPGTNRDLSRSLVAAATTRANASLIRRFSFQRTRRILAGLNANPGARRAER